MPPARWPSFERILEIDKIYTSTTSQIGKLSRVEEHEVEPLSVLPPELMDVIKRKLGCADYFHLRQTSHGNNQAVEDHYCEKIKEAALDAIVQVLGSKSPETINYEFVTSLNDTFLEKLKDGGGIVMHTFGGVQLFDILEIVGYAYPDKLQGEHAFNFSKCSITVEQTKGLRRVLCIQGLKVQTVDLSANGLGHEGAEALAHALRDSTSMTSINLSDNNLTDNGRNMTGILAIASAIRDSPSMTSLDISNNSMGDEGVKPMCEALKNNETLKVLDLNASKVLRGKIGPQGAKYLAEMLGVNTSLTSINLRDNNLTNYGRTMTGIWEIASAIRDSPSLTSIDLAANGLGPEGAKALAPAVRDSASLTSINLLFNNLGPEGAKALAPALRDSPSLTSIDLSSNNMGGSFYVKPEALSGGPLEEGDEVQYQGQTVTILQKEDEDGRIKITNIIGILALANALRVSPSLTSINLEDNKIGPEGAKTLAPAIRTSPSVTCLDVRSNGISGDGASQLSAAVLRNLKMEKFNEIPIKEMRTDSLTTLDLSGKEVEVVGAMVVVGLLPVMASLTSINLVGNFMGVEGEALLREAVEGRHGIELQL